MLSRTLSQVQRVITNPKYAAMRFFGRFNVLRPLAVRLHHRKASLELDPSHCSIFPELDTQAIVNALRRDGLCPGLKLPQDVVQEILDFAASSMCYGNRLPTKGFYYSDRTAVLQDHPDILLGSFYNISAQCPAVKRLEEDPQIRAIAAVYLNSQPILQGTHLWWSFAVDAPEQARSNAAQMYHFDLDDYRFIKFFFYLTDVDEEGGPHVIVKGTHNCKKLAHQIKLRRFSDQEMIDEYGADQITVVCGSSGYGFIEDTLCFHKGYPPKSQDRLVIQVEFGLQDYGVQHSYMDTQTIRQIVLPSLSNRYNMI